MSFDVWTYVARMGSRLRPAPDPFFSDGDAVCKVRTCQYITMEDEEELLHKDFEEFDCPIQGCNAKFSQLLDSEVHYAAKHRHTCSVCKKSLPSAHLLDLHVVENHDTFFQVLAVKRPSYECFLETCTKKFWNPDERKDHCVQDHDFPSNFEFDSGPKKSGVKKKTFSKKSVDVELVDLRDSITPIPKPGLDKKLAKRTSFRVAVFNQESMECSKVDKKDIIEKSPQGQPPYVTQMSEDPSILGLNSLSATPPHHKQTSQNSTKSQLNSLEKRGPVSLANMGLGLTSKSNRHSICIAPVSSEGPSSATTSPVLRNKKSMRENVDQSMTEEAKEMSIEFSPFRRRVYTSGSRSNIPQLIARSSPAKKSLSVDKRSSMPCSSASSTTASSPSPRLSMKMRSSGITSQSSNGSSPEHSKTYMSPVTNSSLRAAPSECGSPSKSRIPVLRSSSVKVPKSICFGFGVKKAFVPSKNWHQKMDNAGKTRADYLSQPDFVDDMRMALD